MGTSTSQERTRVQINELARAGIITALYVAVSMMLSVIAYGPLQIRLSEMFNYLGLFHKRYIAAVTLGVVIVNFFSPMWFLDVPIGGVGTFLCLLIARAAAKKFTDLKVKMVITAIIFSLSMFTVAAQLFLVFDLPFWPTYFSVAVGELFSMTVGGIIIYFLSKKIDFTK